MNTSSTNSIDYVVTQKKEGKYLIGQILIYLFVAVVTLLPIIIMVTFFGDLTIMIPIIGVGLGAPLFLLSFNSTKTLCTFDRKYSIFTPSTTMDKVAHTVISFEIIRDRKKFDPDKRNVVFEDEMRNAILFAPYTPEYKDKYEASSVTKTIDFRSSTGKKDDLYFALFPNKEGGEVVIIFEAVNKIVEKLKYFNKDATIVAPLSR